MSRMNGLRPAKDKSKADAMRVTMDGRVDIKAIKRFSPKETENSAYKFQEDLELMGLLDVAGGSRSGSIEEEKRLERAILRWIGDDERIMTSMRTKMGKASMGFDAYVVGEIVILRRSLHAQSTVPQYICTVVGSQNTYNHDLDQKWTQCITSDVTFLTAGPTEG